MSHPLQEWASGDRNAQAAVHLLMHALDGQLALPGCPWIRVEGDGRQRVDRDRLKPSGVESGGEQRLLAIAHSLLGGEPVDLSWATGNLDEQNAAAVVDGMRIATGLGLQD